MRTLLLAVCLSIVWSPAIASAGGYRDAPWGTSMDDVAQRFSINDQKHAPILVQQITLDRRDATRAFYFGRGTEVGGLEAVQIHSETYRESFHRIHAALIEKYGKPALDLTPKYVYAAQWHVDGTYIWLSWKPTRDAMGRFLLEYHSEASWKSAEKGLRDSVTPDFLEHI